MGLTGCLAGAFKKNLWCSKPTSACAIGSPGWSTVIFDITGRKQCGLWCWVVVPAKPRMLTWAMCPIRALLLRKSKIHKNTSPSGIIVEKVCRFDIPVKDSASVNMREGVEERLEVQPHIVYCHRTKIVLSSFFSSVFSDQQGILP